MSADPAASELPQMTPEERDAVIEECAKRVEKYWESSAIYLRGLKSDRNAAGLCDDLRAAYERIKKDIDILCTVIRTGYAPPEREWSDETYQKTAHRAVEFHSGTVVLENELAKYIALCIKEREHTEVAESALAQANAALLEAEMLLSSPHDEDGQLWISRHAEARRRAREEK